MAATSFKGRHFQQNMILQSVRWYLAYSLSYRDSEELGSVANSKFPKNCRCSHSPTNSKNPAKTTNLGLAIMGYSTFLRLKRLFATEPADHSARPPLTASLPEKMETLLKLASELAVKDAAPQPLLMGRHLIELGVSPGPELGKILQAAFDAQLDGKFDTLETARGWVIKQYLS
jgi:hypothetical protein